MKAVIAVLALLVACSIACSFSASQVYTGLNSGLNSASLGYLVIAENQGYILEESVNLVEPTDFGILEVSGNSFQITQDATYPPEFDTCDNTQGTYTITWSFDCNTFSLAVNSDECTSREDELNGSSFQKISSSSMVVPAFLVVLLALLALLL